MTITEALKISDNIRRKSSELHRGSGGDGWVNIEYLLYVNSLGPFALKKADLLADDWEAKEPPKPKMKAYWAPIEFGDIKGHYLIRTHNEIKNTAFIRAEEFDEK